MKNVVIYTMEYYSAIKRMNCWWKLQAKWKNHKTAYQVKDNKHKRLYSVYFQLFVILEKANYYYRRHVFSRTKGRVGNWKEKGKKALWHFFMGWWKFSKARFWWQLSHYDFYKVIELYPWMILLNINYTSIHLLMNPHNSMRRHYSHCETGETVSETGQFTLGYLVGHYQI